MNLAANNQGSSVTSWLVKIIISIILLGIGYRSTSVWLTISITSAVLYCLAMLGAPLLVAATQNTRIAAAANRTLAILAALTTAAVISAPVVLLFWYKMT